MYMLKVIQNHTSSTNKYKIHQFTFIKHHLSRMVLFLCNTGFCFRVVFIFSHGFTTSFARIG
jgi:hypothetical protein